jgi:hypothetical protein
MKTLQSVILTLQYCLETFEQACQCGRCDPCARGQGEVKSAIQVLEDVLRASGSHESAIPSQCSREQENHGASGNNAHTPFNPEFQLHVLKHIRENRPPAYTIAVWEPECLRALCHVMPLADALQVLGRELENYGAAPAFSPAWSSTSRKVS